MKTAQTNGCVNVFGGLLKGVVAGVALLSAFPVAAASTPVESGQQRLQELMNVEVSTMSRVDESVDQALYGRKFIVKRAKFLADLKPCHILFISKSEREQMAKILAGTDGESILTVG